MQRFLFRAGAFGATAIAQERREDLSPGRCQFVARLPPLGSRPSSSSCKGSPIQTTCTVRTPSTTARLAAINHPRRARAADLAQTRLLDDESFCRYLGYLEYWRRPEYAALLSFPHCLHARRSDERRMHTHRRRQRSLGTQPVFTLLFARPRTDDRTRAHTRITNGSGTRSTEP